MNALLVVTPQPAYLEEVKKWIERLDRSSDTGGGLQFYVYHLQNSGPSAWRRCCSRRSPAA